MAERDLYKILGVPRSASDKEIRDAYRKLARQFHPDRNPGDKRAEEKFKEISYARDILVNKDKRKLYDEFGEIGLREGFNPKAYRQYRSQQSGWDASYQGNPFQDVIFNTRQRWTQGVPEGFQEVTDGFQEILGNEVIDSLFQRAGAGRRRGSRKQDVMAEISIGFTEALIGVEKELSYEVPGPQGGYKNLKVRIPAGVKDEGRLNLRGQGIGGGDLKLIVHVEKHPYFWREGDDLHLNLPVTLVEALHGATVQVPTLDGEVSLRIPKRTNGGAKLRMRGKGAQVPGQGKRGDLIAHIQIVLPDVDDSEIAKVVKDLARAYTSNPRRDLRL